MDIHDRIGSIVSDLGWSKSKFETHIGKSVGYLHMLRKQESVPSLDVIISILEKFPQYSADWLVLGKGNKAAEVGGVSEPEVPYNVDNPVETAVGIVNKYAEGLRLEMQELLKKTQ